MNHNNETAYVNTLTSRLNEEAHDFEIMNKVKGYEAEQLVEDFLKQQHQIVFSRNLEFVSSNAEQINFLIIHNSQISILEVKHYYGDFESMTTIYRVLIINVTHHHLYNYTKLKISSNQYFKK